MIQDPESENVRAKDGPGPSNITPIRASAPHPLGRHSTSIEQRVADSVATLLQVNRAQIMEDVDRRISLALIKERELQKTLRPWWRRIFS